MITNCRPGTNKLSSLQKPTAQGRPIPPGLRTGPPAQPARKAKRCGFIAGLALSAALVPPARLQALHCATPSSPCRSAAPGFPFTCSRCAVVCPHLAPSVSTVARRRPVLTALKKKASPWTLFSCPAVRPAVNRATPLLFCLPFCRLLTARLPSGCGYGADRGY